MEDSSLSQRQVDRDLPFRKTHSPLAAFPVEGKPGCYVIGGAYVTPETVFSYGDRLKGNPHERAKSYVLAESKRLRGAYVCEIGDHYVTELTGEVHHRLNKRLHVAKALGLACHSHNAVYGDPSLRTSETSERENATAGQEPKGEWTSEEGKRSDKMTYRYRQRLYHPETGLKTGEVRNLKQFADELEEELEVGKAQTYERYLRKDANVGYFRLFDEDGTDKIERKAKPYPLSRLGILTASETKIATA